MKLIKSFILFVLLIVSVGCSSEGKNKSLISSVSGNLNEFVNSELNAIEQAKPVIMILPSDKTLRDLGCLKVVNDDGKENIIRNFQKFVNFKRISACKVIDEIGDRVLRTAGTC